VKGGIFFLDNHACMDEGVELFDLKTFLYIETGALN